MQLRYATNLTDEQYVCQAAWKKATLSSCPLHPEGGCGFCRHSTYARKYPEGARIARCRCPKERVTFSLLPDCLASRLSGSLAEVEAVVETAQGASSLTQAAQQLRPELSDVRHGLRWLRRRTRPVCAALIALTTLCPALSGVAPTVTAVREALGVTAVLTSTRELLSERLSSLGHPVGLCARVAKGDERDKGFQHKVGPDPQPPPG